MRAARNLGVSRLLKDAIDSLSENLVRLSVDAGRYWQPIHILLNRTEETLSFGFRAILID